MELNFNYLNHFFLLLFVFTSSFCISQKTYEEASEISNSPKWNGEFNLTQYPASLIKPSLSPIHPGFNGVISYGYNKNEKLQLRQDLYAGAFFHENFQNVVQLYSEFNFKIKLFKKFYLSPLVIGGGYLMCISNMDSFIWDGNKYVTKNNDIVNNWLISVGSNLTFPTNIKITGRNLSIMAKYRIQIQGVVVRNNVPIIAYSPIMIGIGVPLNKLNEKN